MKALPAAGAWGIVSDNTLADVLWKDASGKTITVAKGGNTNVENYFAAWSGGAFDPVTKRLWIAAQGGDGDGADNGAYTFSLATGLWSRVIDPTPALIPAKAHTGPRRYRDAAGKTSPEARHTYGASVAIPGVGAWISGGVPWHPYSLTTRPDRSLAWVATPTGWQGASDRVDVGYTEGWAVWDSIKARVLVQTGSRLISYDPAKPPRSRVLFVDDGSQPSDSRNRFFSGAFDAKRNRMIGAGQGFLEGFDLGVSPVKRKVYKAGGAWGEAPGLLVDPVSDRYVIWPNRGRALLVMDPDTFAVTTVTGAGVDPGTPPYAVGSGTWGRFAYVPAPEDIYLLATRVQGPVLAYRPVRDGSTPPVIPPTPPVVTPPPVVPPVVVAPDPPPPTLPDQPGEIPPVGSIALPTRVLVALEGPPAGKGVNVSNSMKHVTATAGPGGRIYFIGGDYRSKGNPSSQSYVQEGWSLSLAERWAAKANPAAGWREEWPYCAPPGAVQPKHPDYVGWQWDAKRGVLWMVPGSMFHLEAGQDVCPGETHANGSDATYKVALMTFDPAAKTWAVRSTDLGSDQIDTWMSVLDSVRDRIIRFGWSGGSGGVYNVLDLATMKWSRGGLGSNALGKDIRVFKEYMAVDHAGRIIYAIDAVAGRLHAFNMDTLITTDLGPVPGGSFGVENRAHPVWDSTAKRIVFLRGAVNVFDPAAKTWEAIPAVTSPPGLATEYRMAVYDPANNVTLFMGGVENPNPNLLLFRYAAGTGTPPPPVVIPPPPVEPPPTPPPVDPPPPPPVSRVKITVPPGQQIEVNGKLVP